MSKNKFHVEGVARGVALEILYEFYTDYSLEDVEIMREHGQRMALEHVSKKEGNHVVVDTTARIMGMTKNMRYNILLHPEDYSYEMELSVAGAWIRKDNGVISIRWSHLDRITIASAVKFHHFSASNVCLVCLFASQSP